MGLAGALGVAVDLKDGRNQYIELLSEAFIDVARKRVLEGAWFDIRVDRYKSGKLSSNCCLHKCSSDGTRLSDPTG